MPIHGVQGRQRRLRVVLLAALVLAPSCASDDAGSATAPTRTTEAPTRTTVEELEIELVDTSRKTDAGAATPERAERTLSTWIVFPTGDGPHPLLVLSHGATGDPDEYAEQIPRWAEDGFVIASPRFPLTNRDVPEAMGNLTDWVNQPGDVSFVIDEVTRMNDDPESPLHGLVDTDAIGVVGHSLGGATTWAVGFNEALRDDRVDSVTIFAGITFDVPDSAYEYDSGLPLLVLHGDADDVPIDMDRAAWEQAVSPKWFVTLHGAEHRIAFTDEASPYDDLVTRTILDFWHGTLDGDADALARVTSDATDPELSTVDEG